ncbi:MAG: TenA family protein [Hyphomicrobiales bacterium]
MIFFQSLKDACRQDWLAYTQHDFVRQMGEGTLPRPAFQKYLVQDYLFLIQFARAHALAVYKSTNLTDMRAAAAGVGAILDVEMELHVKLCAAWGLSRSDLESTPEASQTIAYTRFVLEAGHAGDVLDLNVALAPCMIGYAEIAKWLVHTYGAPDPDHPYHAWISEYAGEGYQELAIATLSTLERQAKELVTEARLPRLKTLFAQATRLEADFWQMGLDS